MFFTQSRDVSVAASKAGYLIAGEIALLSEPYCEGEFVKTCMLKEVEILRPGKRHAFANISTTRNSVENRVSYLSTHAFSFATDESTDVTDVTKLTIFIRGVDENLSINEQLLELVPMIDSTEAIDISISVVVSLERVGTAL